MPMNVKVASIWIENVQELYGAGAVGAPVSFLRSRTTARPAFMI